MEPIDALVTTSFMALVVAYIVEIVRKHFPNLTGDLIRVVAVAIGYAAALAWGLDVAEPLGFVGLPTELGYLATALVIAGEAGIIGSAKNAIRARDPQSSMAAPISVEVPATEETAEGISETVKPNES